MDFWPEFLASNWGKEFVAGGFGGMTGVMAGHPLDTLRVKQQQSRGGSAFNIFRQVVNSNGPSALYRGMGAPLASISLQNAVVFQSYAILSRAFDKNIRASNPPSYRGVVLGGVGAGALQSLIISPVELVKIRLQLQTTTSDKTNPRGSMDIARSIFRTESWRGIYRGLTITVLRDAPSHGVYFWTYEYTREKLHPGCRKNGDDGFRTMLIAGGLAGVTSWLSCYPLDVIKTRLQAQSDSSPLKYNGIVDCFKRSVKEGGGHRVLWRGLGTTVTRAFVVNAAIFAGYETAIRLLFTNNNSHTIIPTENTL